MRNTASIFLMSLVVLCATGGGMCFAEDCNSNGIEDSIDISTNGDSNDCNTNSIPDECDIASGAGSDCNYSYLLDSCEIAWGFCDDVNTNGVPDECEVPSEPQNDCNTNGIADAIDISTNGSSSDCNSNLIPDECDIASGLSADSNTNGVPDECELKWVRRIRYVDVDAYTPPDYEGNGLTWETAYYSLQQALEEASTNSIIEEIWLAEGTYRPVCMPDPCVDVGSGSDLRDVSFEIYNRNQPLTIYGGFQGFETNVDQRSPDLYVTKLSGDLEGDDEATNGTTTDNTRHILNIEYCQELITLNGLTVQGAQDGNIGGGLLLIAASVSLQNCVFDANQCLRGGAICATAAGTTLTIDQCLFNDNNARSGGAIALNISGTDWPSLSTNLSLVITNSTFQNNDSVLQGGALCCIEGDDVEVGNCIFECNTSGSHGGALYFELTDNIVTTNSVFSGNSASGTGIDGGAIYAESSPIQLRDCEFQENTTTLMGGAVYVKDDLFLADRCVFADNSCSDGWSGGGAIYAWVNSSSITNSLFVGNQAGFGGAVGLYINQDETFNFVNNTVVYNTAFNTYTEGWLNKGGGLEISGHYNEEEDEFSYANVINTILWGNSSGVSGSQIGNYYSTYPVLTIGKCDIQGEQSGIGYPNGYTWRNNIAQNPLFVSDTGDSSGDYRLTNTNGACNECIDAGSNGFAPVGTFDLDVITRKLIGCSSSGNPIVDMGAYEFWDCNANGVTDPIEPALSWELFDTPPGDSDLDLKDYAEFQICVSHALRNETIPQRCLDCFDRAPSKSDSSCGIVDVYDLPFFVAMMTGPDTQSIAAMASMMATPALGEAAENVAEAAVGGSAPVVEPDPWTVQEGDLSIAILPLSGGQTVTTLAPNTSYALNYQADYPGDDFVIVAYAASSGQGLSSARIPENGDWSACTAFSCLDIQTLQGGLGEPGNDGLRRTDVVTGTLSVPCATSGQLCIFKTGIVGTLKLDIELIRVDETTQVVSTMHREMTVDVVSN